jgi:SpoVK/Ycf46/Vps4 family AAA+-type ATPase
MRAAIDELDPELFSSLEERDPIILLLSRDEQCAVEQLASIAKSLGRDFVSWHPGAQESATDFAALRTSLGGEGAIVLAMDMSTSLHDTAFVRDLMSWSNEKTGASLVVLCSDLNCLPALRPHCRFLELPPLTIPQTIARVVLGLKKAGWISPKDIKDRPKRLARLVRLAHGMELVAMDRLIERIAKKAPLLDDAALELVRTARTEQLKNLKFLSLIDPVPDAKELAGLEKLKEWLEKQNRIALYASEQCAIPAPRGMLLVGVPGCGKSLAAQISSSLFSVPLLRLEFGQLRTATDGPERILLRCLDEATRAAPCVLWLDEIDHALGGGDTRSENRGLVGTLASWLQERKRPVFIAATANDVTCLPPELVRKGRFDEIFFVDLPSNAERIEILKVHLTKLGHEVDFAMEPLLEHTRQFTGAEVAAVARDATLQAVLKKEELELRHLVDSARTLVPLVKTYEKEIKDLRSWAKFRARPASENIGILELFQKG